MQGKYYIKLKWVISLIQKECSTAFVSIVLFGMLRDPLNVMPQAFMAYSDAKMSLGHITTFLNTEEKSPNDESSEDVPYEEQVRVGFEVDAMFEWRSPETRLFTLTVRRILFPPGKLSIISGPSSSGKTSMLAALLGDMVGGSGTLPSRFLLKSQQNRNLARDINPSLYLRSQMSFTVVFIHRFSLSI